MVKLNEKALILKKFFIEGKSKSQITREVNRCRNTVRKYINQHEEMINQLKQDGELTDTTLELITKPKYDSSNRKKRILTDEIKKMIDHFIKENIKRRKNRMSKQTIPITQMHEEILKSGHNVSYSTIRNYHNSKVESTRKREAYIKQEHPLGESLEFDYGEIKLVLPSGVRRLNLAVFASPATGNYYARIYQSKRMSSFLDAHVHAFKYYRGIYTQVVYDNLRQAVKRFTGSNGKELTDDLTKLSIYYGFEPRLCNIRRPNEKGTVEGAVEFIAQRCFSTTIEFESIEAINQHLERRLQELNDIEKERFNGKSPNEMLALERKELIDLIPDYEVGEYLEKRVNKYSFIRFDQNNYSVPDYLVGKFVDVKIYPEKVKAFYKNNLVAEHERSYRVHDTKININHYLLTLQKKPGALKNSTALKSLAPEIKNIYNDFYINDYNTKAKEFIELLKIIKENSLDEVLKAIEILSFNKKEMVTTENIMTLIQRNENDTYNIDKEDEIIKNSNTILNQLDTLYGLNTITDDEVII
jgi:transposase